MTLNYNVTGPRRKELVNLIANFTGCDANYKGAPSFAYEVDYFTIDRNGTVSFDDRADSEEIETLLEELENEGFHAEPAAEESAAPDTANEDGGTAQGEPTGLTVEIPLERVKVGNLTSLLDAKGNLIKKALGIENLGIEVTENTVKFPWFSELPDADAVKAYTHFIAALCEMARNAKRVTATEKEVDNEKYAFRCFILRLGFIGAEFKTERKILLRNLSGSSAFKSSHEGGANHA